MENQDLRQIIETIVRAVLQARARGGATVAVGGAPASNPSEGDALALFTGGRGNLESVIENLRRVGRSGFRIDAMLSRGAQWVFGEKGNAEALGVHRILRVETYPPTFEAFLKPYRAVLLPTLTRNQAAKLVWGITDTLGTNLVYSAVAQDIPVVACRDSMTVEEECPDCGNSIPYVRALNDDYLTRLEKLGLAIVDAKVLADEALGVLRGGRPVTSAYRGLVTEEDVRSLRHGEIRVAPGTIITPLAQDHLNAHGIRVRVVEKPE